MRRKELDPYAFVLVLLVASLFSLTPVLADQNQNQVGTVVFHLTGQATSMNATVGSLGSAILDLAGGCLGDGQGGLMIQNLTGNLEIGSTNYPIFTGDAKSDNLGEFTMMGESASGELVLQGIIQHNSTVTTDAPPSRLSTLAYLALSGSMTPGHMTSESVTIEELSPNNVTATAFNNQTITVHVAITVANSTITQTATTTVEETTITVSNTTVIMTNSTNSG